jgi:hypothetical protein
MALVTCSECQGNVSTSAAACPHCGHPLASVAPSAAIAPVVRPSKPTSGFRWRPLVIAVGGMTFLYLVWAGQHGKRLISDTPLQVISEKFELKEGETRSWSLHLANARPVEVVAETEQKPVNVYVLPANGWGEFNRGTTFQYIEALSENGTMHMSKKALLREGDWYVAVTRPKEALLFGHPAVVNLAVMER